MARTSPRWLREAADALAGGGLLVAPAGHGKTTVVHLVADQHGGPVLRIRGRRREQGEALAAVEEVTGGASDVAAARGAVLDALGDDGLLVVDDAQWLDAVSTDVVAGVADRGATVVAAQRPGATGDLAGVVAPVIRLGGLDEDAAADHLASVLGVAVDPGLVDAALARTDGVPALVDALALGWQEAGRLDRGRLEGDPDPVPSPTVDAVRARLEALTGVATATLGALALGAPLDDELLAEVAGIAPAELAVARSELRDAALLVVGHDEPSPVVAATVLAVSPPEDLRARHATVVEALGARGVPAVVRAGHVVAADLGDPAAVAVLVEAAEAVITEDPEQADEWLVRAEAAGADPGVTAGLRATAELLSGRTEDVLRLADAAPHDDRARTARAAVLAGRGLWAQASADLAASPALDAIALLAAGEPAEAVERLGAAPAGGSTADQAMLLAARGAVTAAGSGGDLALTGFADAAELAEQRPIGPVPLTPHALGVTVATAAGELTVARDLAERATAHEVGGPAHARRHHLLAGWVALREGRWDRVEAVLAEPAPSDEPTPLAVLAAALDAGLARRSGDLPRLMATWEAAEPLLLRQPVSPLAFEPTAELVVAAHRLGAAERVAPTVAELEAVTAELPLWALLLDWLLLQAAIASDDHDGVAARARAVGSRIAPGPRLGALAPAASAWLAVLGGAVDADQVGEAADGLVRAGLVWEASRLVGQAAVRTTEAALARSLLERARDVKGLLPAERGEATGLTAPSVLSEREQEIGALVLDGLTHKEIGAQLYIAPKTVEHHVAKIRQKLGVTTRAEMLAALRA